MAHFLELNELEHVINIGYIICGWADKTSCLNMYGAYVCQLQVQLICSRHIAISFCFYLTDHRLKKLALNNFRVQQLYTG